MAIMERSTAAGALTETGVSPNPPEDELSDISNLARLVRAELQRPATALDGVRRRTAALAMASSKGTEIVSDRSSGRMAT